jgi:hypothetical protein
MSARTIHQPDSKVVHTLIVHFLLAPERIFTQPPDLWDRGRIPKTRDLHRLCPPTKQRIN